MSAEVAPTVGVGASQNHIDVPIPTIERSSVAYVVALLSKNTAMASSPQPSKARGHARAVPRCGPRTQVTLAWGRQGIVRTANAPHDEAP